MKGDEEIVRALQSPDDRVQERAEEELLDRYTQKIITYLRKRLGTTDADAEDIASQVIRNGIDQIHTLADPAKLGGWLITSAFHRAVSEYRKQQRVFRPPVPLARRLGLPDPPEGMDGERREEWRISQLRQINQAEARLPPRYREVLSAIVEGLSNAEIAEMEDVSLTHAAQLRHRTLSALRRELTRVAAETHAPRAPEVT